MGFLDTVLSERTTAARERRVQGLVTAKVKSINDGGVYLLEYLTMGDDDQQSAPARVMMPMAGAQRGMHFLPEIGDEVVVAFELGDTSLPIILGGVWNSEAPAPDQAQEGPDNNIRTIVSRAGHELTFDDTAGAELVRIKTNGGHEILLDDAPGQGKVKITTANGHALLLDDTPPGKVELATAGGNKLTLSDAGGQATLESPMLLTIKSQVITLEATAITLKTTGQVTSSMVTIDGKPFGLHQHTFAPVNPSGPVMP